MSTGICAEEDKAMTKHKREVNTNTAEPDLNVEGKMSGV
jgi:hypothetical protein